MLNNGFKQAQDENAQIQRAREQSVVDSPHANEGGITSVWMALQSPRGPILPPWGTRQREWALRLWDRHEYNTLWQGAASGLIKRWCSTPWVVDGGKILANQYQRVLRTAMSGELVGWDSWLATVAREYLRQDGGAWIEVIGGGDPRGELTGGVTGLNVLPSYNVWPTGDPDYPAVYWSRLGEYHLLHRSRVIHLLDMPDGDNLNPGYGLCALSRAIAVVERQMHEQRYIAINLNDVPSSGAVLVDNATPEQVQQAFKEMERRTQTDAPGAPGNVVFIHSMKPDFPVNLRPFTFSRPPEKFDWNVYIQIDVDMMALAIGVDRQDLWPLNTRSMGSGAQSEILAEKAKGKMYGHFLTLLERALNGVFPESLEFSFKTSDTQQAAQNAATFLTWTQAIVAAGAHLSVDEGRRLLADQVEAVEAVVTDEAGQMVELPDTDVRPVDTPPIEPNTNPAPPPTTEQQAQPTGAVSATDKTPNASANKGLETDEQRRWFFAHLADVSGRGHPELHQGLSYGRAIHPGEMKKGDEFFHPSNYYASSLDKAGTVGRVSKRTFSYTTRIDTHSLDLKTGKVVPVNKDELFTEPHANAHGGYVRRGNIVHPVRVDAYAQKDFEATRQQFVANLTDLIQAGANDEITRRRAGIVMRGQLNSAGKAARNDGLVDGGVTSGLSDADLKAHAAWLTQQSASVADFLGSLYKNGLTDAQISQHAEMWANKSLQSAYYEGLQSAGNDGIYEFTGEDGKESCATCKSLKGTKMRLSEWTAQKLLPRVDTENYDCGGWNCQHLLKRVESAE